MGYKHLMEIGVKSNIFINWRLIDHNSKDLTTYFLNEDSEINFDNM